MTFFRGISDIVLIIEFIPINFVEIEFKHTAGYHRYPAGSRVVEKLVDSVRYRTAVVLNLVGGTEPHKFHTRIHGTLRSW